MRRSTTTTTKHTFVVHFLTTTDLGHGNAAANRFQDAATDGTDVLHGHVLHVVPQPQPRFALFSFGFRGLHSSVESGVVLVVKP